MHDVVLQCDGKRSTAVRAVTLPRLWIAAVITASNFAIAVPIAELALLNESRKLTVLGLLALIPVGSRPLPKLMEPLEELIQGLLGLNLRHLNSVAVPGGGGESLGRHAVDAAEVYRLGPGALFGGYVFLSNSRHGGGLNHVEVEAVLVNAPQSGVPGYLRCRS